MLIRLSESPASPNQFLNRVLKSRNRFVMPKRPLPVTLPNTLFQACPIEPTSVSVMSSILFSPSTITVRPSTAPSIFSQVPSSFCCIPRHSRRTAFRLSACLFRIPLNRSFSPVQNASDSLESPTINSQLNAHPLWAASRSASHILLKVRTCLAASLASWPSLIMASDSSWVSLYRADSVSAFISSPEKIWSAASSTSLVTHFSFRVSLNLSAVTSTFLFPATSTFSPCFSSVPRATPKSTSVCLNASVSILAFSMLIQSLVPR